MGEYQSIINFLLGIGMAVGGWFGRQVWEGMKELRGDIKSLEVSMPTTYVNKSDFQLYIQRQDAEAHKNHSEVMQKLDSIDAKFNRVYDKLESKADKQ